MSMPQSRSHDDDDKRTPPTPSTNLLARHTSTSPHIEIESDHDQGTRGSRRTEQSKETQRDAPDVRLIRRGHHGHMHEALAADFLESGLQRTER